MDDLEVAEKDIAAIVHRLVAAVHVAEEGMKSAHALWRKAEDECTELRACLEENTPMEALRTERLHTEAAEAALAVAKDQLHEAGCVKCGGVGETAVEVDGSPWSSVCGCTKTDVCRSCGGDGTCVSCGGSGKTNKG